MDAMPKPIQKVGHVVLKMRDLEKARAFYCGVLGMKLANFDPDRGMFLRFNDYHHDIAIFKTGPDADPPKKNQVGLVHVALVVDSLDTVKAWYDALQGARRAHRGHRRSRGEQQHVHRGPRGQRRGDLLRPARLRLAHPGHGLHRPPARSGDGACGS